MIQERSGNKKAGFLTFVFVILLVDLVIGFVYGYVREAPEKARAAHKPGPVAAQPSDSTPAVSEHHAPEQQPDETNNGHVVEDDPESINAAADAILGVGSPENDPQPQQVPQVDIYETATDDTNTQPKQADDNPEDDLYTFNSAAADTPAKLSEETRKGNECLAKARKLLVKWDKTRSGRDIKEAIKALRKAQDYYEKAKKTSPNGSYIDKQMEHANLLLYGAMKHSTF